MPDRKSISSGGMSFLFSLKNCRTALKNVPVSLFNAEGNPLKDRHCSRQNLKNRSGTQTDAMKSPVKMRKRTENTARSHE